MGLVSWFEARYAEGRDQSEQALEIASELNSLPLIFAAKFTLAGALYGLGALDSAIALQRELCSALSGDLETARLGAAGIPGSIVRSYLCWFLTQVGGYDEGLTLVERAIDIAKTQGEPYSELLALLAKSRNLIRLKRHSEAIACLEHAVELIERNGYDVILPHILGTRASALARSGEGARGGARCGGVAEQRTGGPGGSAGTLLSQRGLRGSAVRGGRRRAGAGDCRPRRRNQPQDLKSLPYGPWPRRACAPPRPGLRRARLGE